MAQLEVTLRVELGRSKSPMKEWSNQPEDTCSCGAAQTMSQLLECDDPLQFSPEDLAEPTPSAVTCARYWQNDIRDRNGLKEEEAVFNKTIINAAYLITPLYILL